MEQLAFFLEKYKSLGLRDARVKSACREAVAEVISYELPEDGISLKDDRIFFNVPSAVRSEIFLHRGRIETILKEKLPGVSAVLLR